MKTSVSFKCAFTILALAVFSTIQPSIAAILHGPVINIVNGHFYYLLTQNTWTASEAEAVQLGGHLATIDDMPEDLWITTTFGEYGGVSRGLWIGLNDADNDGYYSWASGEDSAVRYWRQNYPHDPDGSWNYVHIDWPTEQHFGLWRTGKDEDNYLGLPLHGVVEVVPDSGPVLAIHPAVEITWASKTNKLYQVQWAEGLNTNAWSNLGAQVPGNGSTHSVFDSTRAANKKMYRVVESPLPAE